MTIFNHHAKALTLEKLHEFDDFIHLALRLTIDRKNLNNRVKRIFRRFMLLFFASFFILNVFVYEEAPSGLKFIFSYTIVCHFSFAHDVLLVIFVMNVDERSKLLTQFKPSLMIVNDRTAKDIQKALMMIHDIIQSINDYFEPCFVQTMVLLYLIVINSLFWIGIYFLGFEFTSWVEPASYLAPNFTIVLYLANCDKNIKKSVSIITSTIVNLQTSMEENVFLFLLKRKFSFGSFKLVNIEYSTFAKVKLESSK